MEKLIEMYNMMTEEQRNNIEQEHPELKAAFEVIAKASFFKRMFNDPAMYKAVESSVGEQAYEEMRK